MGHDDHEIATAFSRFDQDGNRVLDEEEQKSMRSILEEKRLALNAEIENLGRSYGSKALAEGLNLSDIKNNLSTKTNWVSQEEFYIILRRLQQLEMSMGGIMRKVETVELKLETLETSKMKHTNLVDNLQNNIVKEKHLSQEEILQHKEGWESEYKPRNIMEPSYRNSNSMYPNINGSQNSLNYP